MTFDGGAAAVLATALERRRAGVFDSHLLLSFESRLRRSLVREYIEAVVADGASESRGGVRFSESYSSSRAIEVAARLRGCLDVLFAFARMDSDDNAFRYRPHSNCQPCRQIIDHIIVIGLYVCPCLYSSTQFAHNHDNLHNVVS